MFNPRAVYLSLFLFFLLKKNNSPACTFVFRLSLNCKRALLWKLACAAAAIIKDKTRHILLPAAQQFSQNVACVIPHPAIQQAGKLAVVRSVVGKKGQQKMLTVC